LTGAGIVVAVIVVALLYQLLV